MLIFSQCPCLPTQPYPDSNDPPVFRGRVRGLILPSGTVGGGDIGAARGRAVWGSFIQNDHIDDLFRLNSIAETGGGGGGGINSSGAVLPPSRSSGGGGGGGGVSGGPALQRWTSRGAARYRGAGSGGGSGGGSSSSTASPAAQFVHVSSLTRSQQQQQQQPSRSASVEEEEEELEGPDWAKASVI